MVYIWDADTSELLESLREHGSSVWCVAFTPDGHGLVSRSLDKTLKYWDISHLANGPSDRQNSPGASERDNLDGRKDVSTRKGNNLCTMNFIGHNVRVRLADRGCV